MCLDFMLAVHHLEVKVKKWYVFVIHKLPSKYILRHDRQYFAKLLLPPLQKSFFYKVQWACEHLAALGIRFCLLYQSRISPALCCNSFSVWNEKKSKMYWRRCLSNFPFTNPGFKFIFECFWRSSNFSCARQLFETFGGRRSVRISSREILLKHPITSTLDFGWLQYVRMSLWQDCLNLNENLREDNVVWNLIKNFTSKSCHILWNRTSNHSDLESASAQQLRSTYHPYHLLLLL